ncbi:MAG TPA: mechanosensitive ion channel domain-containing protein [Lysobacter sp.]
MTTDLLPEKSPAMRMPGVPVRGLLARGLLWLMLASGLAWTGTAFATAPTTPSKPDATGPAPETTASAPVRVWNRDLVTLDTPYRGVTPQMRAKLASERIAESIDRIDPNDLRADWARVGNDTGVLFTSGSQLLFALRPGDAGAKDRAELERLAPQVLERFRQILRERKVARSPTELLHNIGLAALATLVFGLLLWLIARTSDRLRERLHTAAVRRAAPARLRGLDVQAVTSTTLRHAFRGLRLLLVLFATYVWLGYVLTRFPYSRPWGQALGHYLADGASELATGFVHHIPSMLMLVLIFLITRGVVRLVGIWFRGVETGTFEVDWLEPSAVPTTRRLASWVIWLFAITVAYPYIPGSKTDAFKGVSVFVGLMLSLGSAGVISQIVSGFVALYSRAVRPGDVVRIGEEEGVVTHIGTFSLKLVTRTREEVTIPNSTLASVPVRNYTRHSAHDGLVVTTSVTIGYDAPWRQVHALLQLAAARTPQLLAGHKPFVLQSSLSDFYVQYQLNVAVADPKERVHALSRLHAEIQDAFNEFGVQIMSPNFEAQPEHKVWVPPEQWRSAPAPQDSPAQTGGGRGEEGGAA